MPVMHDDLVKLSWRDTDELEIAEGRAHDGYGIFPRARAKALVDWILDRYDGRFELTIEPWGPMAFASPPEGPRVLTLAFWLGLLETALSFVKSHLWIVALLGTAVCALLAVYLPTPHVRAYPVIVLGLLCFGMGFLGSKATP